MALKSDGLSLNELLLTTVRENSEVRIIVLEDFHPMYSRENPIQYRDPRVSDEAYDFYSKYSSQFIDSVAYFLAPEGQLKKSPDRPLLNFPLLVFKKNTPFQAVLHELGHLFVFYWQKGVGAASIDNSDLQDIYDSVAEEVFVDSQLLENYEKFQFTEDDLCPRYKYLEQNRAILLSLLKEGRFENLKSSDHFIFEELFSLYRRSGRFRKLYHVDCFFWKPSSQVMQSI